MAINMGGMRMRVVSINPKRAAELLALSAGNRPIRKLLVARYAKEMAMGSWKLSPEPIIVTKKGRLVQGHHRLHAVILSGCTVEFMLCEDADDGIVMVLDTGRSRTLSDRLNAYAPDRATRRIINDLPGRGVRLAAIISFVYKAIMGESTPSTDEALRIIHFYDEALTSVLDLCTNDRLLCRAACMSAFVLALQAATSAQQKTAIINFIQSVSTGEMLERGEPAYALREYLLGIKMKRRGRSSSIAQGVADSQWVIFVKTLYMLKSALEGTPRDRVKSVRHPRVMIEFFTGSTSELVKKLRLGTKEQRQSLSHDDDVEEEEAE